jgi:hypothetical protein
MLSKSENGCEGGGHIYYILVVNKNGAPLSNIIIRRIFAANIEIPPTGGDKGPGKTEDVAPRYSGDKLYVFRDDNGKTYDPTGGLTEVTRDLNEDPRFIPISDEIMGGFCANVAECSQRITDGGLCTGHYSYRVTFQRQW